MTIDRWDDEASFDRMIETSRQEYAHLDILFATLPLEERRLGVFTE